MNMLIADSGSTQTDWIFIDTSGEKSRYKSSGLNPYFLSESGLIEIITKELADLISDKKVDEIHFYGAGCRSENHKQIMTKAISSCFKNAIIYVESDLLGAARACFGNDEGLACILGTGSNCCFYDGKEIVKSIPSLGFVFGDEGSGGYFGKKMLNSYFYKQMPEDLSAKMKKRFDLNLENVLHHIYKEQRPNQYVASFAPFLFEHKNHPFCRDMIRQGFEEFANKQLSLFGDLSEKKVGVVGSIATHSEILEEVLTEIGITLDIVIQKPINNLVEFHL